jgi:hypothetical protein
MEEELATDKLSWLQMSHGREERQNANMMSQAHSGFVLIMQMPALPLHIE